MSQALFSNNATTTLATAIGPGTTTITVATGTGAEFPSPTGGDWFTVTLWAAGSTTGTPNEIVRCTARTGDTLTVVRGQEGTTPASWSIGDTVANYPTAAWFNNVANGIDLQSQSGNYAVDAGSANAGVASLSPAPASLTAMIGAPVRILKMNQANSGAYTLNLNGFGIKSVTRNGVALTAGQLPASLIYEVVYDGTNFELLSIVAITTNAMLATMAANTVKANLTGGAATPTDVTIPALLTALGFTGQSLTAIGYFRFPNGLIIQWGNATQPTNSGATTVTFPIAFPNGGFTAYATAAASGTAPTAWFGQEVPSTTGCVFRSAQSSGVAAPAGVAFGYFAIGY